AFEAAVALLEHFLGEIHAAVTGCFGTDQAATVGQALAGQYRSEFVAQALVLAIQEADLPGTGADVPGGGVRTLAGSPRHPRAATPMSPAGMSRFSPMWRDSSVMKDWQKRITSALLLPLGSKSEPPLPPPMGRVVSAFLNTCSKARNLSTPRLTEGWKRRPP